jgi:hypothetical protein
MSYASMRVATRVAMLLVLVGSVTTASGLLISLATYYNATCVYPGEAHSGPNYYPTGTCLGSGGTAWSTVTSLNATAVVHTIFSDNQCTNVVTSKVFIYDVCTLTTTGTNYYKISAAPPAVLVSTNVWTQTLWMGSTCSGSIQFGPASQLLNTCFVVSGPAGQKVQIVNDLLWRCAYQSIDCSGVAAGCVYQSKGCNGTATIDFTLPGSISSTGIGSSGGAYTGASPMLIAAAIILGCIFTSNPANTA